MALVDQYSRHPTDILDALAALWTAGRIHRKEAASIVLKIPVDSLGIPMTMWV